MPMSAFRPGVHSGLRVLPLSAGIAFTELSNGFASCDDPAGLQEICDRLQPGTIEVFAQRWMHRIPMPFGPADRDAGSWWDISMRQVEGSPTIVLDAPPPPPSSSPAPPPPHL